MEPKLSKAAKGKKAMSSVVDIAATAAAAAPASRRTISANWGRSLLTQDTLKGYEESGLISASISWRAASEETEPLPAAGEVVVFGEHLFRGFTPPDNIFFRQVLDFYKLRIHDLAPNSILNLSNFVTLCEDYLQIKLDLDLWLDLFYCNPQPEYSGGPLLKCGAVALQQRQGSLFPKPILPSHIKDWQKTYFYCKDMSPADEPFFPTSLLTASKYTPT